MYGGLLPPKALLVAPFLQRRNWPQLFPSRCLCSNQPDCLEVVRNVACILSFHCIVCGLASLSELMEMLLFVIMNLFNQIHI